MMKTREEAAPTVFICYAREDAISALRLSEALKKAGFRTWFDQDRLLAGQHWHMEIRKAIRECDFFLAVLSTQSVSKRGVVQREIKEALDVVQELPEYEKYLIPVRLDPCEVQNETIQNIHRVDLFPRWEVGLGKLIGSLTTGPALITATAEAAPGIVTAEGSDSEVSSLLPPAVVHELLQLDQISRRNYNRRFAIGGLLSLIAGLVTFFATSRLDLEGDDSRWEGPIAAIVSPLMFAASYFLISGLSRWRTSYRARREVVRSNSAVDGYFKREHSFVYRLVLGRWYWRLVLVALQTVGTCTMLMALLFFLVAILAAIRGDWSGLLLFLALFMGPVALVIWGTAYLLKVWRAVQQVAGVPGV